MKSNADRTIASTEDVVMREGIRMFAEKGYHGTSLRQLAASVGVQMSTLYYYFPDKQTFLLRVMERTMVDLIDSVHSALDEVESTEARLRAALAAHLLFHVERREEAVIADTELRALEDPRRALITGLRRDYERIFIRLIERGMEDATFRPLNPTAATFGMLAMCTSVAVWFRPTGKLTLEEIVGAYVEQALRGVMANPGDALP